MELAVTIAAWVVAGSIMFGLGIVAGIKVQARRLRKLILRNKGSAQLHDLTIQPSEDGVMDFHISNAALKRIRRGEAVEGVIAGARSQMKVRLSCS